jgi:hypothetical protein
MREGGFKFYHFAYSPFCFPHFAYSPFCLLTISPIHHFAYCLMLCLHYNLLGNCQLFQDFQSAFKGIVQIKNSWRCLFLQLTEKLGMQSYFVFSISQNIKIWDFITKYQNLRFVYFLFPMSFSAMHDDMTHANLHIQCIPVDQISFIERKNRNNYKKNKKTQFWETVNFSWRIVKYDTSN